MRNGGNYLLRICIVAVLSALGFVLDRFLSVNTQAIKINFAFVPAAFAAALLGPLAGAVVWGLTDLIGAVLLPFGPYHPGFTVCAALMGAVYGWFFYRERGNASFLNIAAAVLINCLVIGLLINTVWISMLYGSKTYWGFFTSRILEYAILVPVQLAVIPLLTRLASGLKRQL